MPVSGVRVSGIVSLFVQLVSVGSSALARPGTLAIANLRAELTHREVSPGAGGNS